MPLLRSVYSNPVQSAIESFSTLSDVLDRREMAPLQRERIAQEIAESKLRSDREQTQDVFEQKKRLEWEKAIGRENATKEKIDMLGNYLSADQELSAAQKEGRKPILTDAHKKAFFDLLGSNTLFDPDKVDQQTEDIRKIQDFMKTNADQLMQGGRLDLDKHPEIKAAVNTVFETQLNKGTDKYGNSPEAVGVKKEIKGAIIDPKDKTVTFLLNVSTPVKEGQVFKGANDQPPTYTVNSLAKGMVEQGNIDIANRPAVRNADGSISTVRSMSFGIDGQEVLIPTVSESGKFLSEKEALREYEKTGKHLGKFDTPEDATAYAEQLHADQQKRYGQFAAPGQKETSYEAPLTASRTGAIDDEVLKIPIAMFDTYMGVHKRLGTKVQQLRAEIDPKAYAVEIEKIKRTQAENKAISAAFGTVDTKASVDEQRKQFITKFTELMPDASVKEVTELAKTIIAERTARQSRTPEEEDITRRNLNNAVRAAVMQATSGENKGKSAHEQRQVADKLIRELAAEAPQKDIKDALDSALSDKQTRQFRTPEEEDEARKKLNEAVNTAIGEATKGKNAEKSKDEQYRIASSIIRKKSPTSTQSEIKTALEGVFPKKEKEKELTPGEIDRRLIRGSQILKDKYINLVKASEAKKEIKGPEGIVSHLEDAKKELLLDIAKPPKGRKIDPVSIKKEINNIDISIREIRAKKAIMDELIQRDEMIPDDAEREADRIIKDVKKRKGIK